jgi:TolA-binding protein
LLAGVVLALWVVVPRPLIAGEPDRAAPPTLKELGHDFEMQRMLSGAQRLDALERVGESVAALLQHGVDPDERVAARLLAAAVQDESGNGKGAAEAYRQALEAAKGGPLAADADFSRIAALESMGRDAEAAGEWRKWLKRFPASPLEPEAQLAIAWNALRRGATAEAAKAVAAMLAAAPWRKDDPRVGLARATTLYLDGKGGEALDALGPRPQGPAATYLKALCLARMGRLLASAAAFQETAERYPDSPLRDHALLAKANTFLSAGDQRSAADEFARVVARAKDPGVIAEAELRTAGAVFLAGRKDSALALFRAAVERHADSDVGARAQFLVGEALVSLGKPEEAIVEYNQVLTRYFQHAVAASAQYRVARCLDRLGRRADATGAYEAVVAGYPLQPEAPAAAYLAGVGLLAQDRPLAAAPYLQLLLDRYAPSGDGAGPLAFSSPERQELVEAALCLLELSYHRAGDLGQLSGAPHLLLQRMPAGQSQWRAWAILIDADASAAQGRYPEAQAALERIMRDFPDHAVATSAAKLLAWSYARQGRDSLAIATEERLLARAGSDRTGAIVSGALLDIAHVRFNQKRYREAAAAYEDFLRRFPDHAQRLTALYLCGVCYLRLDRAGDAVDRWELIVRDSASAAAAERAWARMGDVYFQAEKYEDAKRCYQGLLDHFAGSTGAALASLRLGQCEYNAGRDAEALQIFSATLERYPNTPMAGEARRGTELALYRLSQRPDGAHVLEKLVEQFPASSFAADAQLQIAKRAYAEKRWSEAADGLRRVVSGFPGYSAADQAQFLMADAWSQAGERDEARQAYEQFLSYFPTSDLATTVQFRLGLGSFEDKDYLRAAVSFTRVLGESTSTEMQAASRYNLALCDRQLGRADDTRTELERYRKDWPGDARAADVAYQLADLDEAAGRREQALHGFEDALAARPRPALATELAYRVGLAREQLGQGEAALHAYQQAAATGGRDDPFRLSAVARSAALYEKRHEYRQALAAYRDIVANAQDRELVAAATEKVTQLAAEGRRR